MVVVRSLGGEEQKASEEVVLLVVLVSDSGEMGEKVVAVVDESEGDGEVLKAELEGSKVVSSFRFVVMVVAAVIVVVGRPVSVKQCRVAESTRCPVRQVTMPKYIYTNKK